MSDEEAGGQYLCQFAARCSETVQTGGTPKLVDLGGDVDTHQRESLREAGTQEVLWGPIAEFDGRWLSRIRVTNTTPSWSCDAGVDPP